MHSGSPEHTKAIVVAGAGARGAYEAAALEQALPMLFPRGLESTYLIGTSAGAINVALLASRVAADQRNPAAPLPEAWKRIHRARVFNIDTVAWIRRLGELGGELSRIASSNATGTLAAPFHAAANLVPLISGALDAAIDVPGHVVNTLVNAVSGVATLPFRGALASAKSLLDTSPLWATADEEIDFDALNRNVEQGRLAGVGIVATSCPMDASGGRSRVFLKTRDGKVPSADGGSIDYVPVERITAQHVLASAAIPGAFPAVAVKTPAAAAGYYIDGGVRLNTPLEPAIKLGAKQILVVSSHAASYPKVTPPGDSAPSLPDALAQSIHSVLADGLIEDLRNAARINAMVATAAKSGIDLYGPERQRFVHLDIRVIAPENGQLSPLAHAVARDLQKQNGIDAAILRLYALLGQSSGSNELLSYLLFEPEYFEGQFAVARSRAQDAIAGWGASAFV